MKKLMQILLGMAWLTILAAPATMAEVQMDPPGLNTSAWLATVNQRDTAALRAWYTEDAVIVSTGSEINVRPEGIMRLWSETGNASDFELAAIDVRHDGTFAYQTAVWVARLTINGVSKDVDGTVTTVYQRQADGNWKIRLQTWN